MMIFSRGLTFYISGFFTLMIAATFPMKMVLADPVKLDESTHASQVFEITSSIKVTGKNHHCTTGRNCFFHES